MEWINSTDLESTSASTEEVAVSPEVLPAVCTAMVETTQSQLKNVSFVDSSSSSSGNFKTSGDSELKHLIENLHTKHSTATCGHLIGN